jgi:hypothetical protein
MVEPRSTNTTNESLSIVRYSQYQPKMFPYDYFEADDEGVVTPLIDADAQGITFSIKRIKMLKGG